MISKYPENARFLALQVLLDVHENGAYASLALQKRLRGKKLMPADRRLVTSLVYTVLERQEQLDYVLDNLMEQPTQDSKLRDILRISACQILFHQRIPDSAAVNEGVNLAKKIGKDAVAGFLNAVLRNLVRNKETIDWPKPEDGLQQYLHIMGNMPVWLVEKYIEVFGSEEAETMIMHHTVSQGVSIRLNTLKTDAKTFEAKLNRKSWKWEQGIVPQSYLVQGAMDISTDFDFKKGLFSMQGQASMMAAEAVQVKPGMHVLDACAAPGGKTAYMAESMQDTGRVFAWDVHPHRTALIEAMKNRLQLENIRISVRDAARYKPDIESRMDAVLLDAPCTGLGVLSEKPDLRYRLQDTDLPAITQKQAELLETVSKYVKPGGTLVYSTCSVLPEENEEQIKMFLANNPSFSVQPLPHSIPESFRKYQTELGLQLYNHRDGVEGFFISRMIRKKA